MAQGVITYLRVSSADLHIITLHSNRLYTHTKGIDNRRDLVLQVNCDLQGE